MNDGSFVHPNIVKDKDRELESLRELLREANVRIAELELQIRSYKAQADYVEHSND